MASKDLVIFDCDMVLSNSAHRQKYKEDGKLDLDHWRANCTEEQIKKDVPQQKYLAKMLHAINDDKLVVIMTARVLSNWDYQWFKEHLPKGITGILSREGNDTQADHTLKLGMLEEIKCYLNMSNNITMYDDNPSIINAMQKAGVNTHLVTDGNKT